MPSSRPGVRLRDILDNIALARSYVQGLDQPSFTADRRTRDAVERCLERISEAAAKLGEEAERLAPGPPWHAIRAVGNVLRHAYDQVDAQRIWEIVDRDLPVLKTAVTAALQLLEGRAANKDE